MLMGLVTRKIAAFEVPPPGTGFLTLTSAVRGDLTSTAKIRACSVDELRKVVTRVCPFQVTVSPETNPVPFTVSMKPGFPGTAAAGTRGEFTKGTGLDWARRAQLEISARQMAWIRDMRIVTSWNSCVLCHTRVRNNAYAFAIRNPIRFTWA